jgi:UDP-GlcNAc:undecaprenyl-phosphate GlcNAc-1-phosphate transferase
MTTIQAFKISGSSQLFVSTALFAIFALWGSAELGLLTGLVDHPDERKQHLGSIPLTGGIAIAITLLFGTFVLDIEPFTYAMAAIAALVFTIGVYDDYTHLNPAVRLLIQYGSGVLLATYGGITINNAGNLLGLGDIPLMWLAVPLTALSVAGLCNAYNMIDGIDGLAAATVIVPLSTLYLLALAAHHPMSDNLLLLLIPTIAFACFNLGPNTRLMPKIFLGDGGSITLGFLTTAALVFFSQGDNALINPVTALWLVTVPLMDMLATMFRRFRKGRNLMAADRSHLHHTLMDMGLSPAKTLILLTCYSASCAFLGLLLEGLPESISLLAYFLLFLAHGLFVTLHDPRHSNAL